MSPYSIRSKSAFNSSRTSYIIFCFVLLCSGQFLLDPNDQTGNRFGLVGVFVCPFTRSCKLIMVPFLVYVPNFYVKVSAFS